MANTLTGLYPVLYEALDTVSRELVGFVRAVNRDSRIERASKDQTVRVPVVPTPTAGDITPAVTPPDDGDQTVGSLDVTINKSRRVPVRWAGEETLGLRTAGTYDQINRDRFAQAMRVLVNEMEADCAATYVKASRAYGTAGTTPFATADDLSDIAELLKVLKDNGAPGSDLHLVLNTTAMAKLRGKHSELFKVNEAGTEALLRDGVIGRLQSFSLHESAQVKTHAAGTGSGYLVNDASLSTGDTTIAVDTGTGTILAGDVVTVATDATSSKYVVGTALSGSSFALNKPGLRDDITDSSAITVGAAYSANMAFDRNAIILATRAPALPEGGDSAVDRMMLTDPVSGLSFEVSVYEQYRQIQFEVAAAWGAHAVKSEHMAILLG